MDPSTLKDGAALSHTAKWSDNGQYFAYGVHKKGADWEQFYIRDADSMKDLPDELNWIKFSQINWTKDGKGFMYSRYPAPSQLNQKVGDKGQFDTQAGAKTDKLAD